MSAEIVQVGLKSSAEIEFRGLFKVRLLLGEDGKRRVVVGEIATAIGVDFSSLRKRILRQFAKGMVMMATPSSGGAQATLALDIHYLPALLVGIQVDRCREEVRPRLQEVQEELYDALAAYTFEGTAVNPAFAPRALDSGAEVALSLAEDVAAALRPFAAEMVTFRAEMKAELAAARSEIGDVAAGIVRVAEKVDQASAGILALREWLATGALGRLTPHQIARFKEAVARVVDGWIRRGWSKLPTRRSAGGEILAIIYKRARCRSIEEMPPSAYDDAMDQVAEMERAVARAERALARSA